MKLKTMIIITLIGFMSGTECECEEPINTWFKYSNDINSTETYGKLITLDMSSGYATTDGSAIYLIVRDSNNGEWVTIGFPMGYWEAWFPPETKKEFIDLEDYLKSMNKNNGGIEKK